MENVNFNIIEWDEETNVSYYKTNDENVAYGIFNAHDMFEVEFHKDYDEEYKYCIIVFTNR